jgi:hypothetical protein
VDSDALLAREARLRPRAGLAAIAAGVVTLAAGIVNGLTFADAPAAGVLRAVARAAEPGPVGSLPSLRIPFFEFYDEKAATLIASAVANGLGLLLSAFALTFLAFATRTRRPEFPRPAFYLPAIGGVLIAVGSVMLTVATVLAVNDFLDSARTVEAARDVGEDSFIITGQLIQFPGSLAFALAFVMVSLNAMRAGLLTRFMGVLGIIVGVLLVFPIGSPLPIVQCFWLGALGALLLNFWPSGVPPAWRTGKAEPWPSTADVREARKRAMEARRAERAGEEPVEDEEPVAVGAPERPHPSSKKRKRKRRN